MYRMENDKLIEIQAKIINVLMKEIRELKDHVALLDARLVEQTDTQYICVHYMPDVEGLMAYAETNKYYCTAGRQHFKITEGLAPMGMKLVNPPVTYKNPKLLTAYPPSIPTLAEVDRANKIILEHVNGEFIDYIACAVIILAGIPRKGQEIYNAWINKAKISFLYDTNKYGPRDVRQAIDSLIGNENIVCGGRTHLLSQLIFDMMI